MESTSLVGMWIMNILMAILIVVVGRIVVKWLMKLVRKLLVRANVDPILVNFCSSIINVVLMLFVFIAALDRLGVDTTSLVALIAAAGLAVGLALQGSLQNFAAGVLLVLFRPFKIGDVIEAAGTLGKVEKISIFSTTLVTPDNKDVIVPNGQIYSGNITNISANDTRRVDLVFGIGYGDDLLKAKKIMQDIIDNHELVLDDPAPAVAIAELADSSVNFHVRPWVKSADWWTVRCDVIEQVKLAFDENGISIPYPQMDVHLNKISE